MNRDEHIISSLVAMVAGMGIIIAFFLQQYKTSSLLWAYYLSIGAFLLGVIAPDFDHHSVQKKMHIHWLIGRITKHRGHFHSIIAAVIYAALWCIFYPLLKYWYLPVIAAFAGYMSHLIEDQIAKIFRGATTKPLKVW